MNNNNNNNNMVMKKKAKKSVSFPQDNCICSVMEIPNKLDDLNLKRTLFYSPEDIATFQLLAKQEALFFRMLVQQMQNQKKNQRVWRAVSDGGVAGMSSSSSSSRNNKRCRTSEMPSNHHGETRRLRRRVSS